jgi:hypothetical protein
VFEIKIGFEVNNDYIYEVEGLEIVNFLNEK